MSVLISPILTEKAMTLSEKSSQYLFRVKRNAKKVEVKRDVEKKYNVSVKSVKSISVLGKSKIRYTKTGARVGRAPSYKKALVILVKGQMIDYHSVNQLEKTSNAS